MNYLGFEITKVNGLLELTRRNSPNSHFYYGSFGDIGVLTFCVNYIIVAEDNKLYKGIYEETFGTVAGVQREVYFNDNPTQEVRNNIIEIPKRPYL